MGKPASVAGQGGKVAFDEDAFGEQLPAKFGTWVFQQRFAAHAAGCLSAVAMAGVLVPELRASTTLRRRWQDFCLGETPVGTPTPPKAEK